MKSFNAMLFVVVFSGCTALGTEKVATLGPEHEIVVVSFLGDNLNMQTTGTTIWNNWHRNHDVSAWDIDKYVEQLIGRKIEGAGKFVVLPADTRQTRERAGQIGTNSWTTEEGAQLLTALAQESGADSILVVGPSEIGDKYFGTYTNISGYGVYQRSFLGIKRAINHAVVELELLDGDSGDRIARTWQNADSPRDKDLWIAEEDLVPQSNQERTRLDIESVLDAAITKALTKLTLI